MIDKTSVIYKNNTKKKQLNHKTLDCDKMIFLSWYNFFKRFLPITSKYMSSISFIYKPQSPINNLIFI